MHATMTKLQVWERWKQRKAVGVFAAYEDAFTAARGMEFCRGFAKYLGPDCVLKQTVWLLDEFRAPKLKEIAAGEAAVADLVLISVHHHQDLPEEFRLWVETWLGCRGNRSPVLLILPEPGSSGEDAIKMFLEEVAERQRLEFLLQSEETHGEHRIDA